MTGEAEFLNLTSRDQITALSRFCRRLEDGWMRDISILESRIETLEGGNDGDWRDSIRADQHSASGIDVASLAEALEQLRPFTVINTKEYARLLRVNEAADSLVEAVEQTEGGTS